MVTIHSKFIYSWGQNRNVSGKQFYSIYLWKGIHKCNIWVNLTCSARRHCGWSHHEPSPKGPSIGTPISSTHISDKGVEEEGGYVRTVRWFTCETYLGGERVCEGEILSWCMIESNRCGRGGETVDVKLDDKYFIK